MYLKNLQVRTFRNLGSLELEFNPHINFIYGQNGQGKTNLLESIAALAHGRSFRTSRKQNLIQHGDTCCAVSGELQHLLGSTQLRWILQPDGRSLFVNEKKVESLKDYLGRALVLAFSPLDIELVRGGPINRRKFLDRHACELQPILLNDMVRLTQALKAKSALLFGRNASKDMLCAVNKLLAPAASKVWRARSNLIKLLNSEAHLALNEFAPKDGMLELSLESDLADLDPELLTDEMVERMFDERNEQELRQGRVIFGPQRDELKLTLAGKDARQFASQGQSRSIALALLLSIAKLLRQHRNEQPILLLDDIESELDKPRTQILLKTIGETQGQAFITSTAVSAAAKLMSSQLQIFHMQAGRPEREGKSVIS